MVDDMVSYIPCSPPENKILSREGVTRDIILRVVRLYAHENDTYFSMIFGLNAEGVLCSPVPNWTPAHPKAFSGFELVPWRVLRPYYGLIWREEEMCEG